MATASADADPHFTIETESETDRLIRTPPVAIVGLGGRSCRTGRASSVVLSVTVNTDGGITCDQSGTVEEKIWPAVAPLPLQIQGDDRESPGSDDGGGASSAYQHRELPTHCHIQPQDSGVDKKARFRLILASVLCLIFMIGEIVGGVLAHSLAVVSDAAHLLTDFASFMISLVALYLVTKPATKRLSFGWHRAEIIGALISILMLWVITGVLAYSAVLRVQSGDYEINSTIMLITSATGVFFNIVLGCTLHQHGHSHGGVGHSHGGHGHSHDKAAGHEGHSHEGHHKQSSEGHSHSNNSNGHSHGEGQGVHHHSNSEYHGSSGDHNDRDPLVESRQTTTLKERGYGSISDSKTEDSSKRSSGKKLKPKGSNINVKAAFIHVVGDLCQSVGVLVAALIIFFKPEWKIADPICTFVFSFLVLITTVTIMRDILMVLMEATPRNLSFEEVRDFLLSIEGVRDLHDLRLWSLTMNKVALSVHLAVDKGVDPMLLVSQVSQEIQSKYNIHQTTMQVERYEDEMSNCRRCQDLKG